LKKKESNLDNEDFPNMPSGEEPQITIDLTKIELDEVKEAVEDIAQEHDEDEEGIVVVLLTPEQRNRLVCRKIIHSHIISMHNEPDGAIRVFTHPTCVGLFFSDEDFNLD